MKRHLIALLCASSAVADYVVDWRVPQANDANANAWVAAVTVPVGEKAGRPRRPRTPAPAPRRQAATGRRRGGGAAGAQALLRIGAHVCGGRRRRVPEERHHAEPGRLGILRPLHRHLVPTVQELSLYLTHQDALCIRSKNSFTWWNGTPAKRARLSSSAASPT